MAHKILIVDDEERAREELAGYLTEKGYDCEEASGVGPALASLHGDSRPTIVLADLKMPGRDGLALLTTAKAEVEQDLEFVVIAGYGGIKEVIGALRLGAHDFLQKPIDLKHLLHIIERADRMLCLRRSERLHQDSLKAEVEAKTAEVRSLVEDLKTAYEEALDILAVAAEYRDSETGDHIRRLGAYARFMASELGWSRKRQEMIELAAPLHDVGKIGTPDAVLLKPGKLGPDEVAVMKKHAEIGHHILSRSGHPVMRMAANIAWNHHERWDGSGYPRSLKGEEIPIEARIVALADIYDALRSERPYKPAFNHEKALKLMLTGNNRTMPDHFDPGLLRILSDKAGEFARIFAELAG